MTKKVSSNSSITPEQIDELLPQTQCGLCGYGGCMPYAEAMLFENAALNLCPPGGVKTLHDLGDLLKQDITPFIPDMQQKQKPSSRAVIREAECIGCTKCIQACPVDAILGAAKQMHVVLMDQCTGCELCLPPCPVDCIDMLIIEQQQDLTLKKVKANQARQCFHIRETRLKKEQTIRNNKRKRESDIKKQQYIHAALERTTNKKNKSKK